MVKRILASAALASVMIAAPAMAGLDRHLNPSLNSYIGHATDAQYEQPTAFRTLSEGSPAEGIEAVGSGNPSAESFNPNAVGEQPARFRSAPSVAESPDFDWIDRLDIGA